MPIVTFTIEEVDEEIMQIVTQQQLTTLPGNTGRTDKPDIIKTLIDKAKAKGNGNARNQS